VVAGTGSSVDWFYATMCWYETKNKWAPGGDLRVPGIVRLEWDATDVFSTEGSFVGG
jgi:hypothetical protein